MRKAIAKRLSQSKFTAPHYYLSVEFNMDNAIAFREQYNSIPNTKISFNDIVIKACAIALKARVNSQWSDEKTILNNHVHGVYGGVDDGLVVPVIKFADSESLHSINSMVRDFAVRAKSKKLRPDEIGEVPLQFLTWECSELKSLHQSLINPILPYFQLEVL